MGTPGARPACGGLLEARATRWPCPEASCPHRFGDPTQPSAVYQHSVLLNTARQLRVTRAEDAKPPRPAAGDRPVVSDRCQSAAACHRYELPPMSRTSPVCDVDEYRRHDEANGKGPFGAAVARESRMRATVFIGFLSLVVGFLVVSNPAGANSEMARCDVHTLPPHTFTSTD